MSKPLVSRNQARKPDWIVVVRPGEIGGAVHACKSCADRWTEQSDGLIYQTQPFSRQIACQLNYDGCEDMPPADEAAAAQQPKDSDPPTPEQAQFLAALEAGQVTLKPSSELIDAAAAEIQPVKIVGLTGLNVRALRETFPEAVENGDLILTATTATWTTGTAGQIYTWLSTVMSGMPTRDSWKQSLHAVRRKLAKAAAESPEGQAQKQAILEKLGLAQQENDLDALPALEAAAEAAGHQYGADDDTAGDPDHNRAAPADEPGPAIDDQGVLHFQKDGKEQLAVVGLPGRVASDQLSVTVDGVRYGISISLGEIPGFPGVGLIARPDETGSWV